MQGPSPESVSHSPPPSEPQRNALATRGLACSISSLALLVLSVGIPFAFFVSGALSIAGLVCGVVGRRRVVRGELAVGKGKAQAALALGILSLVLHVAVVVLLLLALPTLSDFDVPEPDNPPGPAN